MDRLTELRLCCSAGLDTSAFRGLLSVDELNCTQSYSPLCFDKLQRGDCELSLVHRSDFLASQNYTALPYGVRSAAPSYGVSLLLPSSSKKIDTLFVEEELDLDLSLLRAGLEQLEHIPRFSSYYFLNSQDVDQLQQRYSPAFVFCDRQTPHTLLNNNYRIEPLAAQWQEIDVPWISKIWLCSPELSAAQQLRICQLLQGSIQSANLYVREWAEMHGIDRDSLETAFISQTQFSFSDAELKNQQSSSVVSRTNPRKIGSILRHASNGGRISSNEALRIVEEASFEDLMLAAKMAQEKMRDSTEIPLLLTRRVRCRALEPRKKTKVHERHNRSLKESRRTDAELLEYVQDVIDEGGSRIELEALYAPELDLLSYQQTIKTLTQSGGIDLFAFCPEHIWAIASSERLSVFSVLQSLFDCGLSGLRSENFGESFDGAQECCQMRASELTSVYQSAHVIGLETKALVTYSSEWQQIFSALEHYRSIQDSCQAFEYCTIFPQHPVHYAAAENSPTPLEQYLRILAVTRLYLDNFENIASSVNAVGLNTALLSLEYGANSFGEVYLSAKTRAELAAAYRSSRQSFSQHLHAHGFESLEVR